MERKEEGKGVDVEVQRRRRDGKDKREKRKGSEEETGKECKVIERKG